MYRCVVVLALLAGCYSPSIAPGSPCETACPGDLVCVASVCREPGYVPGIDAAVADAFVPVDTVDAPPGDGDADGVVDTSDNCPTAANADQHDEDGDAIGDVCDPCPHLAGTSADGDGDGDGVGDACDPQPTVGKQRIAFFDPFTSDRAEWSKGSGVSRVGETLRLVGTPYTAATLQMANAETRVALGGTLVAVTGGAVEHQIALEFSRNGAGTIYHYGEFYDVGGPSGAVGISRANQGVYTTLAQTSYTGVMPIGAWSMRLDTSVASQQVKLATTLGGTTRPTVSATASTPALAPSSTLQIGVNSVEVRVDYVVVIETMP